jgi:hypothetical protein
VLAKRNCGSRKRPNCPVGTSPVIKNLEADGDQREAFLLSTNSRSFGTCSRRLPPTRGYESTFRNADTPKRSSFS